MMTFSEEVKMTITATEYLYPEIELYGAVKGKGDFVIDGKKKFLKITVTSINSMKRIYKLCKILFGDTISAYVRMEKRLNIGRTGEIVILLEIALKVFQKYNIDLFDDSLPSDIKNDPIKMGVFLKGMFLTTGSISLTSSYHLEFFLDITENFANELINSFASLLGVKANYIIKNNKIKLYIKASGDIINILEIMNAYDMVEKLNEIIKVREIKGNVTRTINFLTANAIKTADSSSKQIDDIELLKSSYEFEKLPESIKKVALYRMQNPDESLNEIAEALQMKKSTVYSRIKKINELANQIRERGNSQ
ncbi:MAG: DNA-binding protein WhiA [Thermotogae bacterium]|nr:DNA-binding protein WhiA [Thermotogota bacterium]HOO74701.1 DNA-binding protein WhiA [Tepiditoga sp.]